MKVILNTNTFFEGKALRAGDEIEVNLNVAQRWINKGIAHPVFEVKSTKEEPNIEIKEDLKIEDKKEVKKPTAKAKKK